MFAACGELLALGPGWPGSIVRKAFYAATLAACADRFYIGFGTVFAHRAASVGRDVYIGPYGIIGTARIGDGAKIATESLLHFIAAEDSEILLFDLPG